MTLEIVANAGSVPWLESFSIGHDRLDHEHRRLIDSFNDFCAFAATTPRPTRLRENAHALIATVEAHFASEEAIFPLIGYRHRLSHMREHLDVGNRLHSLLLNDTGLEPAAAGAAGRLVFVEHILRHDLEVKTWVLHAAGL
ncbi:MAG: hemerythrin domain-containing protein [Rhodospirillaceae bacterium]|nr:hemerythrin domain-containing protein [Rhodospirillales bacterium]